jgi:drug/metabolite transporter (DMT)-like permease
MDLAVFLAVLAAAACNAGWNAVVKGGGDALVTAAIMSVCGGLVSLPFLFVVGLPNAAAWPWVGASVVIHLVYFASLIEAYRHGDLGQIYPLARGGAPLMTGIASAIWVGEQLDAVAWAGLLLLVAGVLTLSLGRSGTGRFNARGVGFASMTAVTISAYSIVDGLGARASGNAASYTLFLFIGCAVVMALYAVARRGTSALAVDGRRWRIGLFGGGMQVVSYGIVVWAMTVAPIALVAALRETSVLFGALIAIVILKERLHAGRAISALVIVAGIVALRLA